MLRLFGVVVAVIGIIGTIIGITVDVPELFSSETTVPQLIGSAPDKACEALSEAKLRCAPNDYEATSEINVVHEQEPRPGAIVPKGTTVTYTYENTAPLPLRRYQASTPDKANFISPTKPGPVGWSAKPSPGRVYAAGEDGVPGLIPIHQYRCTAPDCKLVYFLSRNAHQVKNFVYEYEAFRCFNPDIPPPLETQPLQALINNKHARTWAVPGTIEYQRAISSGFKDPSPKGPPLCYVWP